MFPSGIEPITNYKFLQRWFRSFKKNGRKLVVPEIYMANMKLNKAPPFLQVYPELQ